MELQSPTVLCVDDDPEVLEVLSEYFTGEGFNVLTATNGVEALYQVARGAPQAVILDLFMPRPGGLVALDRIKRLDPRIAVILVSGVPNVVEMIAEAGVPVAGAFRKPVDLAQISEALARAGVVPPSTPRWVAPVDLCPSVPLSIRKRVLVVDDEPEIREVLVEYLRGKGFEACAADDGVEALRRLPEFRPQIVLLDIAMPGLSGIETLHHIKGLPQRTCVVMVSGKEDEEILRRTLAIGAEDYVPKPVDFGYLDSVLELHMEVGQFDPEFERVSDGIFPPNAALPGRDIGL